jgi:hypothetical protein
MSEKTKNTLYGFAIGGILVLSLISGVYQALNPEKFIHLYTPHQPVPFVQHSIGCSFQEAPLSELPTQLFCEEIPSITV